MNLTISPESDVVTAADVSTDSKEHHDHYASAEEEAEDISSSTSLRDLLRNVGTAISSSASSASGLLGSRPKLSQLRLQNPAVPVTPALASKRRRDDAASTRHASARRFIQEAAQQSIEHFTRASVLKR